jgi:hypothetical protein
MLILFFRNLSTVHNDIHIYFGGLPCNGMPHEVSAIPACVTRILTYQEWRGYSLQELKSTAVNTIRKRLFRWPQSDKT